MIEVIKQSGTKIARAVPSVHPDWSEWIDASAYNHEVAQKELGLAHGTYFRRIAKAPSLTDRLAMRALYEGLEPYMDGE